jgi:DNA-directed RNA polymerase subunit RPC12/RpoP
MEIEVTCPNCKEKILVPDSKRYIECPYCGEELSLPIEGE